MEDFSGNLFFRALIKTLAPRPKIQFNGRTVVVESDWRTLLLSLGARKRKVTVDSDLRFIILRDRHLWVFSKYQRFEFDEVREVLYQSVGVDTTSDYYRVGLWLKDGREVVFFRIYGTTEFDNQSILPDWVWTEEVAVGEIASSNHDAQSLNIVELLGRILNVPVGGPLR